MYWVDGQTSDNGLSCVRENTNIEKEGLSTAGNKSTEWGQVYTTKAEGTHSLRSQSLGLDQTGSDKPSNS